MISREEIKNRVVDLIKSVSIDPQIENIDDADIIEDFLLSSIIFISLIVEIEKNFDIEIADEYLDMNVFRKIDQIVDIIYIMVEEKWKELSTDIKI